MRNKKEGVPEGFCTAKETAKILKIDPNYVLGLFHGGAITGRREPAKKNGRYLIDKKSISNFQSFLANRKHKENKND
jgi:hypothetical protein